MKSSNDIKEFLEECQALCDRVDLLLKETNIYIKSVKYGRDYERDGDYEDEDK